MGSKPKLEYDPDFAVLARQKMREGYTIAQMKAYFGVSYDTLYRWKAVYPEFAEALKRGAEYADAIAEESLYRRVAGYDYDEIEQVVTGEGDKQRVIKVKKIRKHIPPDVTAGRYWLNNRRRDRWRYMPTEEEQDVGKALGDIAAGIQKMANTNNEPDQAEPETVQGDSPGE